MTMLHDKRVSYVHRGIHNDVDALVADELQINANFCWHVYCPVFIFVTHTHSESVARVELHRVTKTPCILPSGPAPSILPCGMHESAVVPCTWHHKYTRVYMIARARDVREHSSGAVRVLVLNQLNLHMACMRSRGHSAHGAASSCPGFEVSYAEAYLPHFVSRGGGGKPEPYPSHGTLRF